METMNRFFSPVIMKENQLFGLSHDRLFSQALEETKICTLSKEAFINS